MYIDCLAAGITFVLAVAAAACSWTFAPVYKSGGGSTDPRELFSAPGGPADLRGLPPAQWLVIVSAAGLCAVGAWALWSSGAAPYGSVRGNLAVILLMSAMMFDFRTHLIPNFLVAAMFLSGAAVLIGTFILSRETFARELIASLAGLLISFAVFYLLSRLTKNGLGMGDVKLLAAMAWLVGMAATLWSVLFALLLCMAAAVFLMLIKKKSKSDMIPFGPFIFLGYITLLVFL